MMTNKQIIQFWKDDFYRLNLTEIERELLPENPAGLIELSNSQLASATGGKGFTAAGDEACHSGIIACTLPINCPVIQ